MEFVVTKLYWVESDLNLLAPKCVGSLLKPEVKQELGSQHGLLDEANTLVSE
jgi:hypothetical protein